MLIPEKNGMSKKIRLVMKKLCMLLALFALVACKNRNDIVGGDEGVVSLSLKSDASLSQVNISTKSEVAPTPDMFRVWIENTKAEVLRTWESYDNLPDPIKLVEGSYKFVAQCGDYESLPAFGSPVYGGEAKFEAKIDQPTAVELTCVPMFTKITVDYLEDFSVHYSDCTVDVKTAGDKFLSYSMTDTREGYFKPGVLRLRFNLTRKSDGQKYSFTWADSKSTKAAQFYRLHVNTVSTSGGVGISIVTDEGTTDVDITKDIPEYWLPKSAPELKQAPVSVTVSEGKTSANMASVVTYAGVKSAVISCAQIAGLESGIDVITANTEQRALLRDTYGISWSEALNDPQTALALKSNNNVMFNFTKTASLLDANVGGNATCNFTLALKDKYDQAIEPCNFAITVTPPVFGFVEPTAGNAWTKSAYFDLTFDTERENYRPTVEVSKDNGATWSAAATEVLVNNSGSLEVKVGGLAQNTTYLFRTKLGKHIKNMPNLTTETETQIPNADMEAWTVDKFDAWGAYTDMPHYKPWGSGVGEWWNTSNPRSFTYNGFPAVPTASNSAPSVVYTNAGKSGKAAEIRSVRLDIAGRENVVGKLLIGSLTSGSANVATSGFQNPENITEGRPFGVRPTQVKFWMCYDPYGAGDNYVVTVKVRSGDAVIAEKVITGTSAVQIFEQVTIDIPYSNIKQKATSLYICFASSKNKDFEYRSKEVLYPGWSKNYSAYLGSVLTIDDVELVYER